MGVDPEKSGKEIRTGRLAALRWAVACVVIFSALSFYYLVNGVVTGLLAENGVNPYFFLFAIFTIGMIGAHYYGKRLGVIETVTLMMDEELVDLKKLPDFLKKYGKD